MRDTSGISSSLVREIPMLLEVRWKTKHLFLVARLILGFLSIFKKSQESSTFKALNSACFSKCQRDVRPPVPMIRETKAFSRLSTGDSAIPSSCEMKDKTAFKKKQGNPAFFRVRASRCLFHLRQQTRGPFHIPISEGSLLLRCLWKVGLPLQSKSGNQLSS